MFIIMAGRQKGKMAGLAGDPKVQTWSVEKCFMRTQNEGGDGDGRIGPGRVQKMLSKQLAD